MNLEYDPKDMSGNGSPYLKMGYGVVDLPALMHVRHQGSIQEKVAPWDQSD
jgi:hypothetical protein